MSPTHTSTEPRSARRRASRAWSWLYAPVVWFVLALSLLGAFAGYRLASPRYGTKSIEEIAVDDYVLARDEFGNDIGLKRVVEVYVSTSDHLRILTFQSFDGAEQTLKTTDDHPIWVVSRDAFVDAKHLQPGDQFASPHGPASVSSVPSTSRTPKACGFTTSRLRTITPFSSATNRLPANYRFWYIMQTVLTAQTSRLGDERTDSSQKRPDQAPIQTTHITPQYAQRRRNFVIWTMRLCLVVAAKNGWFGHRAARRAVDGQTSSIELLMAN